MKFKNRLFGLLSSLLLSGFISNASAGLVTEIKGLDIGGTFYNATFHSSRENSFRDLWDEDGDFVFGEGDASMFNSAPTFWGDELGALAAANALITFFGSDGVNGTFGPSSQCSPGLFCDSFLIPFMISPTFPGFVSVYADESDPDVDVAGTGSLDPSLKRTGSFATYVAFQMVIPEPASLSLFGLGLAAVGWSRRKPARRVLSAGF